MSKLANAYSVLARPDFKEITVLLSRATEQLQAEPSLRNQYAVALHRTGQTNDAIHQLRQAFNQYKGNAAPMAWEAMTDIGFWYRTAREVVGDAQTVEKLVDTLTSGNPDPIDLRWIARLWASTDGGMSRALELHQRAITEQGAADPQMAAELYYDLARYYIVGQRYEDAVSALGKVLEHDTAHKLALNNFAYLLATELQRPADAIPYIERLEASLSGRDTVQSRATFLDTIGWVYWLADQLELSEERLRESVSLLPGAGNVVHLATVLAARGEYRSAESYLEQADEFGADPATAAEIKRLLDDIRTKRDRR